MELLNNLDKLHTTELGIVRVKRNLSLDTDDVVAWCKNKISSVHASITREGKNWYVAVDGCIITVNAHSYTIITAHKLKNGDGVKEDDMKYTWMDEYLLGKTGVTKDLQKDWNWIRYQIGGKMFAAVCMDENNEPYYITLKLEPLEGDFLRQQYEDIIPGYYMNKMHWNSVKADGEVPDDLLKDLLDKSYQLVLGGFSKKKQREILEG